MRQPGRHVISGPAGELVAWEHAGDAPATLLLHGIGNYGRYWDLVAREVNRRLSLVAPDARGHGDSVKPANGYATEDFVADTLAILDALTLDRVVLVGHSMGGGHAIALARLHPERVHGLVVVDVGPELLPEGRARSIRLSLERPPSFPDEAAALAYLHETSPGYGDEVYRNRIDWVFRHAPEGLAWRSSADALRQILTETRRAEALWDVLGALHVPTLVVRGTRSNILGAETARRMVETLPDGRLLELDAGHNVPLDQPRAFADALVAFSRETTAH